MRPKAMIFGNVRLDGARECDAASLIAIHDPEATKRFSFFDEALTQNREEAYLRRMVESPSDLLWIVRSANSEHAVVGTAGLHEVDIPVGTARLGVIIWNKKSQGCGYGTAAVNALCHYAFTALGVSKVYANVRVANDRGRAYYARLGFVEEKILPNWYVQEGKSSDMVHMGILKQEWQDRQNREDR